MHYAEGFGLGQTAEHIGRLVDRAIQIAWRYKRLWLFGIFAGYGMNFNIQAPDSVVVVESGGAIGPLTTSVPEASIWTVVYLIGLFFLCYTIAIPSLTSAVYSIVRRNEFRFGECILTGIDVFLPVLALSLAGMVSMLVILSLVALVSGVLFGLSTALGWLSLLLTAPLGIGILFVYSTLLNLSIRDIVIRRARLRVALQTAMRVLSHRFRSALGVFLIILGIVLASVVALRFCFYVMRLVVALITGSSVELLPAFYGVLLGLPFSLLVGGFFGVVAESLYTLYYLSVEDPSRDDIWATTGIRRKSAD